MSASQVSLKTDGDRALENLAAFMKDPDGTAQANQIMYQAGLSPSQMRGLNMLVSQFNENAKASSTRPLEYTVDKTAAQSVQAGPKLAKGDLEGASTRSQREVAKAPVQAAERQQMRE